MYVYMYYVCHVCMYTGIHYTCMYIVYIMNVCKLYVCTMYVCMQYIKKLPWHVQTI